MRRAMIGLRKLKAIQDEIVKALNESYEYEPCKQILQWAKGLIFVTKEHQELIEYTKLKKQHFEIDSSITKILNSANKEGDKYVLDLDQN